MLKADFEALVSSAINRGIAYNSFIAGATRRAVSWFERNYNFPYMRKELTYTRNPGDPTTIGLNFQLKKIGSLSYLPASATTDALYYYPTQVERSEIPNIPVSELPEWFYLHSGVSAETTPQEGTIIEFGTTAWPEQVTIELLVYQYTNYLTWAANLDHWLLTVGEDAVLAKTMQYLIPFIRQPEKMPLWQEQFAMALPTLLQAAEQIDYGPQDLQLEYS